MFSPDLLEQARNLLEQLRARKMQFATAESCTGGLIAGLMTEIPGSSDVVDRGFVTYSNEAKMELLGVPFETLQAHGAVSEEVVRAMAAGALKNSRAQIAVAVSGVAGPGGGTVEKPVGLVHIAASTARQTLHRRMEYGSMDRSEIRLRTVKDALALVQALAAAG